MNRPYRITIEPLARLLGEKSPTLRQQFHQGVFGNLGKVGRERLFGLTDVALLKLAYALRDREPVTFSRGWRAAGAFLEPLIAEMAQATDGTRRFAVVPHSSISKPFLCSADELAEALAKTATSHASVALTVVDLSALAAEIMVEWSVAVGLADDLRRDSERLPQPDRERMDAMITAAQHKIGGGTKVRVDTAELPPGMRRTANGTLALEGRPEPAPAPAHEHPKVKT